MKTRIIDILDKMADGTLEDGFKFEYKGESYTYNKQKNSIFNDESGDYLGELVTLDLHFLDEIKVIEDVKEIKPILNTLNINSKNDEIKNLEILVHNCEDKINELVQAVNELRKEQK